MEVKDLSQLRRGNIVNAEHYYNDSPSPSKFNKCVLVKNILTDAIVTNLGQHIECNYLSFVELTEELLLRLSAEKQKDYVFIIYGRFKLIWKSAYKYWYVMDFNSLTYLTKVEFVHEWQNFVFIMDGTELELKPQ